MRLGGRPSYCASWQWNGGRPDMRSLSRNVPFGTFETCPAYPENVRSPGVDRKSPWSGQTDANDPSQTLAAGRANRDFDRRATLGGLFSALTGTNGSTNFKRQRDDNQGKRRQCCPIKALSTIPKNSRFSDRS